MKNTLRSGTDWLTDSSNEIAFLDHPGDAPDCATLYVLHQILYQQLFLICNFRCSMQRLSPVYEAVQKIYSFLMSILGLLIRRYNEAANRSLPDNPFRRDDMRVMVMVKATADSESGAMPTTEQLAEMGQFNDELVKAGIMVSAEGLHPSAKGKRVRFSGKNRAVFDGPFAETKELVAGFWIWQVSSMEEAVEWVRRCPNPMPTESEIEIRPIFEAADFGEEFTPELREQEEQQRQQIAQKSPDNA